MKYIALLFSIVISLSTWAQSPDFSMYGYATMDGGTTGGASGPVVTPTNFTELQNYASGTEPYTILIDREFKGPNVLRMGSNKTLLGVEDKAFINQIGISINSQHNIIIRNIRFTMTGVPISNDGENKIEGFRFDPDCIAIQADDESLPESERVTHHIWIDHCEFYNEDPNVMTDYDRYDGLLDMKNDVQYVTISWNYFHDHHKASLSGKGNSDDYDRKTTMHHNKFENIKSRMPLLRYGKLHMLNNYLVDCPEGNGLNVRVESNAYVEKNYFDNVKKPVFGKMSEGGRAHLVDNRFIDCGRLSKNHMSNESPDADPLSDSEEFEDSDFRPPYNYQNLCVPVNDVPAIVNQYAGIGKIEGLGDINQAPVVEITSPSNNFEAEAGDNLTISINATDTDGSVTQVVLYQNNQVITTLYNAPYTYTWNNLSEGDYEIKTTATDNEGATNSSSIMVKVTANDNVDCAGVEFGNAYLDDCQQCVSGTTGEMPCVSVLQFEDACEMQGVLESSNEGFSGIGYANLENVIGSYLEFNIEAPSNGYYELRVVYANGSANNRPLKVTVNTTEQLANVDFNSTSEWTIWEEKTIELELSAGNNRIRFESLSEEGAANLDHILTNAEGVSKGECSIITSLAKKEETALKLYPNPTDNILHIEPATEWSLVNALGNLIDSGKTTTLDMSAYSTGVYFIKTDLGIFKIVKK